MRSGLVRAHLAALLPPSEEGFESVRPLREGLASQLPELARDPRVERALDKLGTPAETDEDLGTLEAIVLPQLRPVVFVDQDSFGPLPAPWTHLGEAPVRACLERALPSIGRIDLPGHPSLPYAGTGFLVGKGPGGTGLLMTNRHVAQLFAEGRGLEGLRFLPGITALVDLRRERQSSEPVPLSVDAIVMIHPWWDMALLRVSGEALERTSPLLLDPTPSALPRDVAVIGYPAQDARNDLQLQLQLFEGIFHVKRLQPGRITGTGIVSSFGNQVAALLHDASTLGGNSGSAVIDAGTGKVIGLHFGGRYLERNFAVPMYELARDSRVLDLGLFEEVQSPAQPPPWAHLWGDERPLQKVMAGAPAEERVLSLVREQTAEGTAESTLSDRLSQEDPEVVHRALERRAQELGLREAGLEEPGDDHLEAPADPLGKGLPLRWSDWLGGNEVRGLDRSVQPRDLAAVQQLVQWAAQKQLRVKATASGHADNAMGRPVDVRVDVRQLAGLLPLEGLKVPHDPTWPPGVDPELLVRVGAGTTVAELNELLARQGLALPNMGSYDGQQIAGAIGTGTHGSGQSLGPLADFVTSVDIVGEDGILRRFEPEPGVSAAVPGGQLVQGEAFWSVLVALGAVGVVVALTLSVRRAYRLAERREIAAWPVTRARMRARLAAFRHYEILINPYPTDPGPWRPQEGSAHTTVETLRWIAADDERGMPVPGEPERPDASSEEAEGSRNPLLKLSSRLPRELVVGLMNVDSEVIPWMLDQALKALEVPWKGRGDYYVDRSDRVLKLGVGQKAHGFEIAVPLPLVERAVDIILEVARLQRIRERPRDRSWLTSPFSVRFVRGSRHTLAPMHHRDRDGQPVDVWAMIEIPRLLGTRNPMEVVDEVERRLKGLGCRPHWGQHNTFGPADTRLYPGWGAFQEVYDTFNRERRFSNAFTGRLGLDRPLSGVLASALEESTPAPPSAPRPSGPRVVNLEGEGFLSSTGAATTTETQLRALFDHLPSQDLVLYAHGGLVSEANGLASARSLSQHLESTTGADPLMLVWETGPLEVLPATVLDLIRDRRLARRLLWWVVRTLARPLVPGWESLLALVDDTLESARALPEGDLGQALPEGLVGSSADGGPAPTEEQIAAALQGELQGDLELRAALDAAAAEQSDTEAITAEASPRRETRSLDPAFVAEVTAGIPREGAEAAFGAGSLLGFARWVARVALAVHRRQDTPSWNGGRQVVVEEVLRAVGGGTVLAALWQRMKRNALGAYQPGRGGALLMELVAEWLGGDPQRRLHLVAHSAGAFHLGAWVRELERRLPGRSIETVVLLAPACDHAFFKAHVAPHAANIRSLRLFALQSSAEDTDRMVPRLYESSLLCFVSGLLEAEPGWPLLGMARFLERAPAEVQAAAILAPTEALAEEGARSGARQHGAFDDDSLTRESLSFLIRRAMGAPDPTPPPSTLGGKEQGTAAGVS